jgi:hypothetical protein
VSVAVNNDDGFPGPGSGKGVGKAQDPGSYHRDVEPGVQYVSRIQAPALFIWEVGTAPADHGRQERLVDQKPAETVK